MRRGLSYIISADGSVKTYYMMARLLVPCFGGAFFVADVVKV